MFDVAVAAKAPPTMLRQRLSAAVMATNKEARQLAGFFIRD
jgi:hypothetical protein